jgi:hypothetical protein
MESCLAFQKKILPYTTTLAKIVDVVLSEISQVRKRQIHHCMISPTGDTQSSQTLEDKNGICDCQRLRGRRKRSCVMGIECPFCEMNKF